MPTLELSELVERCEDCSEILGFHFHRTCYACPEQYEVYEIGDWDTQVAYVRVRWGVMKVQCPDCGDEEVVRLDLGNDIQGILEHTERSGYLFLAARSIRVWLNRNSRR